MALPDLSVQESTVPYNYSVLMLSQNTAETVTLELKNRSGVTYNFTDGDTITLYVKEFPKAGVLALTKTCTVDDDGNVVVTFTASDLDTPGVYWGEFAVIEDGGTAVSHRIRCYLNIDASIAETNQSYDPLTIDHLRVCLRDRGAEDNFLLDDVEWSDGEIASAIIRSVGIWNECRPINSNLTYTQITFPYKEHAAEGAIGELLHSAALNLTRNRMPVQTGGVTTDDKARSAIYLELANKYKEQYKIWVISTKASLNAQKAFGTSFNESFI